MIPGRVYQDPKHPSRRFIVLDLPTRMIGLLDGKKEKMISILWLTEDRIYAKGSISWIPNKDYNDITETMRL